MDFGDVGITGMISELSLASLCLKLWRAIGRRRRRQFKLLLVLMVVGSLAEVISLGSVLPFLGALASPDKLLNNLHLQPIFEFAGVSTASDLTLVATLAFCIASVLVASVRVIVLRVSLGYAFGLGAEISLNVYRRSLHQPYAVHVARNSSEIINAIAIKTSEVIFYVIAPAMTLFSSLFMAGAILATLGVIVPVNVFVALAAFGVIYAAIMKHMRRGLQANSNKIALESTNAIRHLQEGLGGIRDILLDGTQEVFVSAFERSDSSLRKAQRENQFASLSPRFVMESAGMILIALIALGFSRGEAGLTGALPVLAALALGLQRLLPALQQVYYAWSTIQGAQGSLRETVKLLEQVLPLAYRELQPPLSFKSEIEIRDVSFSYSDKNVILDRFSLVIGKGARMGFVGQTGSGKSTLLDLIMGLLYPTRGQILVDGVPITEVNAPAWRQHIAHVPQDLFLRDGTVAENIAFGVPPSEIDIGEVRKAAQKAQIATTIESWSRGYETLVGERGVQLSGGQRQRIGIARALYKKADVIVFDEATSALDMEIEEAVMSSIENLDEGITILIIAHRLSTLRNCDKIVELTKPNIENVDVLDKETFRS